MKDIVLNKESIRKNLSFYGLFIMVYEQFFNEFYNRIYNLFADDSIMIIDNDILVNKHSRFEGIKFTKDKVQDIQIKKLKDIFSLDNDFVFSMYKWMSENYLITNDEFEKLKKIKERRNTITHELYNLVVSDNIVEYDKELFSELIKIRNNAFKNWIDYYEFIDENNDFTLVPTIKIDGELVDLDNFIINSIKDIVNENL